LLALLAVRLVLMAVVPVFEPSEARYAAISANMARSGDFVVPRFTYNCEYQSFDGKPPLVFQAGGMFISCFGFLVSGLRGGENPYALQFAVRVFPLLSAVLLLVILFHSVKLTDGVEAARLAVVICASCTAFYAAAGMSMTDMTLTCCVAGALLLYECYVEVKSKSEKVKSAELTPLSLKLSNSQTLKQFLYMSGMAALLGAGMMTKGPVALVMFGLPVFVDAIVNKHWRFVFTWKWLAVAPVFFIIAVPWFVLIEQRNPGAVWYFFYNENFMRFVSHDYGDKYGAGREAFRGVAVLWALVATLPWALVPAWFLSTNFTNLHELGKRMLRIVKRFDMLALLAIVGFWCLTSRVLIYYLFPVVPLFAAALAKSGDRALLKRFAPWCAGLTAVGLSVALLGGMFFSEKMMGAKTPFDYKENHYANEFYHGTKPAEELAKHRAEYVKLMAAIEELEYWKKIVREQEKKKGESER